MKPKVLVGCPTSDYKEECLEQYAKAVKKLRYDNYDILLVDNSQTNDYSEKIKKLGLNVVKAPYFEGARERIVSSRNILREYAIKNNYDYLLSLEQDVIPPEDIIEKLLRHNKKVVTGVYYIHNVMPDGKIHLVPLVNILEDNKKTMRTLNYSEINMPRLLKIYSCGLGCLLIHKDILKEIKFRYVKEVDTHDDRWFCIDLHEKGIDLYCDNTIICKHLVNNRKWKWSQIKK